MNQLDILSFFKDGYFNDDFYLVLVLKEEEDPKIKLDLIKNLGYNSYLRLTSIGKEIVISGKRIIN
jgi:hypothetical protein